MKTSVTTEELKPLLVLILMENRLSAEALWGIAHLLEVRRWNELSDWLGHQIIKDSTAGTYYIEKSPSCC